MVDFSDNPFISIIIPCRNEEIYIAECLDSVTASDYPAELMEILVIDGMSNDNTRFIAEKFVAGNPNIQVFENPDKTAPYAMNLGIDRAKGDLLFIISAHAGYPDDYFTNLVSCMKRMDADVAGGVMITDVKNKNPKTRSIRSILSSPLGVGNAWFRTGIKKIKEVDTVPFGCYRKSVFEKFGRYNTRLTRNQDIELNKRIRQQGGKIYLVPDIYCIYFARETFSEVAYNNYRNGHWNILTVYITKTFSSLSWRHFVPLALILSLLAPIIASLFRIPGIAWLSLLVLVIYQVFIVIAVLKAKNSENSFIYLWWGFMTLHFSYGFGSLTGIFRIGKLFGK